MKKIGFLSFGHWMPSPQSQVRTASDALLQSIELAVAAATPSDLVLVAGKGHETYQEIGGQRLPHSDLAAVEAVLR